MWHHDNKPAVGRLHRLRRLANGRLERGLKFGNHPLARSLDEFVRAQLYQQALCRAVSGVAPVYEFTRKQSVDWLYAQTDAFDTDLHFHLGSCTDPLDGRQSALWLLNLVNILMGVRDAKARTHGALVLSCILVKLDESDRPIPETIGMTDFPVKSPGSRPGFTPGEAEDLRSMGGMLVRFFSPKSTKGLQIDEVLEKDLPLNANEWAHLKNKRGQWLDLARSLVCRRPDQDPLSLDSLAERLAALGNVPLPARRAEPAPNAELEIPTEVRPFQLTPEIQLEVPPFGVPEHIPTDDLPDRVPNPVVDGPVETIEVPTVRVSPESPSADQTELGGPKVPEEPGSKPAVEPKVDSLPPPSPEPALLPPKTDQSPFVNKPPEATKGQPRQTDGSSDTTVPQDLGRDHSPDPEYEAPALKVSEPINRKFQAHELEHPVPERHQPSAQKLEDPDHHEAAVETKEAGTSRRLPWQKMGLILVVVLVIGGAGWWGWRVYSQPARRHLRDGLRELAQPELTPDAFARAIASFTRARDAADSVSLKQEAESEITKLTNLPPMKPRVDAGERITIEENRIIKVQFLSSVETPQFYRISLSEQSRRHWSVSSTELVNAADVSIENNELTIRKTSNTNSQSFNLDLRCEVATNTIRLEVTFNALPTINLRWVDLPPNPEVGKPVAFEVNSASNIFRIPLELKWEIPPDTMLEDRQTKALVTFKRTGDHLVKVSARWQGEGQQRWTPPLSSNVTVQPSAGEKVKTLMDEIRQLIAQRNLRDAWPKLTNTILDPKEVTRLRNLLLIPPQPLNPGPITLVQGGRWSKTIALASLPKESEDVVVWAPVKPEPITNGVSVRFESNAELKAGGTIFVDLQASTNAGVRKDAKILIPVRNDFTNSTFSIVLTVLANEPPNIRVTEGLNLNRISGEPVDISPILEDQTLPVGRAFWIEPTIAPSVPNWSWNNDLGKLSLTFPSVRTYTIQLRASDGILTNSVTVTVKVQASGQDNLNDSLQLAKMALGEKRWATAWNSLKALKTNKLLTDADQGWVEENLKALEKPPTFRTNLLHLEFGTSSDVKQWIREQINHSLIAKTEWAIDSVDKAWNDERQFNRIGTVQSQFVVTNCITGLAFPLTVNVVSNASQTTLAHALSELNQKNGDAERAVRDLSGLRKSHKPLTQTEMNQLKAFGDRLDEVRIKTLEAPFVLVAGGSTNLPSDQLDWPFEAVPKWTIGLDEPNGMVSERGLGRVIKDNTGIEGLRAMSVRPIIGTAWTGLVPANISVVITNPAPILKVTEDSAFLKIDATDVFKRQISVTVDGGRPVDVEGTYNYPVPDLGPGIKQMQVIATVKAQFGKTTTRAHKVVVVQPDPLPELGLVWVPYEKGGNWEGKNGNGIWIGTNLYNHGKTFLLGAKDSVVVDTQKDKAMLRMAIDNELTRHNNEFMKKNEVVGRKWILRLLTIDEAWDLREKLKDGFSFWSGAGEWLFKKVDIADGLSYIYANESCPTSTKIKFTNRGTSSFALDYGFRVVLVPREP